MSGHRPFSDLLTAFTPERRAGIAAEAARLDEEMTLAELREARDVSQEDLAQTLAMPLPAVTELEGRDDLRVSILRRYVEALGGTLEIAARFPDATVVIHDPGSAAAAE